MDRKRLKDHLDIAKNNYSQSIAELIKCHCMKNKHVAGKACSCHNHNHGTPLPVSVGMTVYAQTRKRRLIDKLHDYGFSVLYDCEPGMVNGLDSTVCDYFSSFCTVSVCPRNM